MKAQKYIFATIDVCVKLFSLLNFIICQSVPSELRHLRDDLWNFPPVNIVLCYPSRMSKYNKRC